jgi:hypothetical protein
MKVKAFVVGDMCDEHEDVVMLQMVSRWTAVVEAGCGGHRGRTMDVGVEWRGERGRVEKNPCAEMCANGPWRHRFRGPPG